MWGDEARVIEAFLRGEPQAVTLVDRWIARAASPFRRRLSSDWEDLLQEARLETLRLLQQGRFRGEAALATYLWRVVGCLCVDVLRRRSRNPLLGTEELDPQASRDPSPFDRVLARERDERVLEVLESMPEECRHLWGLILQGLSYKEIGEKLAMAVGALRVRAHRCRKAAVEALDRSAAAEARPDEGR